MSPHVAVTLAFLCGALSTLGATFLVWGGALHYLRHALVCSWCGHQFEDWDLGSITVTIAGGPADGPPISAPRAVQSCCNRCGTPTGPWLEVQKFVTPRHPHPLMPTDATSDPALTWSVPPQR